MSENVNTLPYSVDLGEPLKKTALHTLFVMGDKLAHRFELTITNAGKPADLTQSTVTAYFTNFQENTTIKVDGDMENDKAVVTLSEACYTLHGQFVLFIQIKTGEAEATVFQGDGYMRNCKAEKIIYDNYVIYDVNTLLSQIEEMKRATADAKAAAQDILIVRYNADTALADKTQAEIRAAVAEKRACIAIDSKGRVYNYVGEEDDQKNKEGLVPTFRKAPDYDGLGKITWDELQILSDGTMHIWGNSNAKAPNPKTLRFTGAVSASYDGSAAVTVEIPESGSGSGSGTGGGLPTGGEPNMMLVTDSEGNAEWQERTHGTMLLNILPEHEVEINDGQAVIEEKFTSDPIAGETYFVTFNGSVYECVSETINMEGVDFVAMGNTSLMGGTQTLDAPFCMFVVPSAMADAAGGSALLMVTDESTSVTLKVSGWGVKKLSGQYLPKGMPYYNDKEVELLPETSLTYEDGGCLIRTLLKADLSVGTEYIVTWCGVEYPCVAKISQSPDDYPIFLGNESRMFDTAENTGEPFVLCVLPETTAAYLGAFYLVDAEQTDAATIAIKDPVGSIHKLASEYQTIESVNGKIGKVVLTASDVGALAAGGLVADVSDLTENRSMENGFAYTFNATSSDGVAYNVTLPALAKKSLGLTQYSTFLIKIKSTSTSKTPTLNVNGNGAKRIYWRDQRTGTEKNGTRTDWLQANHVYRVFYTLSAYIIVDYDFLAYVDETAVYLNSSTSGSTKRFKITVDDSGTITATEVT